MHLSGDFNDWQSFGDYLRILARQAVPRSLREKLDESDVVQESLLQAFRQKHNFRGKTQAEFLAWLRRILERQLCDVQRRYHRAKRDVARERAISKALEHSSCQLEQFADMRQATASDKAIRKESVVRVAGHLQRLSAKQREAVELHYLSGLGFSEVAHQMDLNRDQVAGLIRRGLQKLKELNSSSY